MTNQSDTPKTDAEQVLATYEGLLGNFVGAAFARAQERDIARLRGALQMIAENTVVPDAFPDTWDDMTEAQQSHVSALLIARAALEGSV